MSSRGHVYVVALKKYLATKGEQVRTCVKKVESFTPKRIFKLIPVDLPPKMSLSSKRAWKMMGKMAMEDGKRRKMGNWFDPEGSRGTGSVVMVKVCKVPWDRGIQLVLDKLERMENIRLTGRLGKVEELLKDRVDAVMVEVGQAEDEKKGIRVDDSSESSDR
ncbi:unnamed protein product [Tuber aestivum]|uniref:Uncharacterized protein n=1 Tax=Tuber aestivum TaxID=59557 RepID=A0A292Q7R2_9PEZI|nr:unnamed protein product [Tuber aestivum]